MLYGIYEANQIRRIRLFPRTLLSSFCEYSASLAPCFFPPYFRFPVEFNFQVTAWLGMEFVSPVWGDVCLLNGAACVCWEGRSDNLIALPSDMKWSEKWKLWWRRSRDGGGEGWRTVTWRGIETDAVYSSNFESVISNLIWWRISVINALVCVRACAEW
jgi:hypothetical protein